MVLKKFSLCGSKSAFQSLDEETEREPTRRKRRFRRPQAESSTSTQPGKISPLRSNNHSKFAKAAAQIANMNMRADLSGSGPSLPPREHPQYCENCSGCASRAQNERALQQQITELTQEREDLQESLDEARQTLGSERSILDEWQRRFRRGEEKMKTKINDLKSKNEALQKKLYLGRKDYVTKDEIRDCLNTWHSKATTFCPKFFAYNGPSETQALPILEDGGRFMSSSELFYYERRAQLFEIILARSSEMLLAMAQRSLDWQKLTLEQTTRTMKLDSPPTLPLWPSITGGLLDGDSLECIHDTFVAALHGDGLDRSSLPRSIRSYVVATMTLVYEDMEQIRGTSGRKSRDDTEVRRRLDMDSLFMLLATLLLNLEASSRGCRFVRIEKGEPFDGERMEAIGNWPNAQADLSNYATVRLAITRALMECDSSGTPQNCIAKAWVIVRPSDSGYE